jgi:hypothetical protein
MGYTAIMNHTYWMDLQKLGRSAQDQEEGKI